MKNFIRTLLLGKHINTTPPVETTLKRRIDNLWSIWNGEHYRDRGIERLLRLWLAVTQFFILGTYIKHWSERKGAAYRDLAMDAYILFKVLFPLIVLITGGYSNTIVLFFIVWFMFETIFYIPTLIFASDIFTRPHSYKRSILLLLFNYMQIVLDFAVIHQVGNYLNEPINHWIDAVYFSFITSMTIGYGDFYPVKSFGKIVVSMQSLLAFSFVVLFLNFFTGKIEHRGYFDHTKEH